MSEIHITHNIEITDRGNTLKTHAFKLEKFQEHADQKFTPCLMYFILVAITTLSSEKSLCHSIFFGPGPKSPLTPSALLDTSA